MTIRRRGMDHDLYGYVPVPLRPKLIWPDGNRIALCVFLYFEYWELDPPAATVRDMRFADLSGYYFPDYRTYTWREYGNRVGIFRILDLLDRHAIVATVAANASACERYPFLVAEFQRRGYEFAAHGTHATRMHTNRMDEGSERAAIAQAIETVTRTTGQRPSGWIGQDFGESTRTPPLLAEAGLSYVVDWPNDDQPYAMTVGQPFVSIPNQAEWDDVQLLWHRRVPNPRYPALIGEAFDRLYEEGAVTGKYFGLHIHPWLSGMPHRIRYLETAIERLAAAPNVWRTTAGAVSQHMLSGRAHDPDSPTP